MKTLSQHIHEALINEDSDIMRRLKFIDAKEAQILNNAERITTSELAKFTKMKLSSGKVNNNTANTNEYIELKSFNDFMFLIEALKSLNYKGVSMYINDKELSSVFDTFKNSTIQFFIYKYLNHTYRKHIIVVFKHRNYNVELHIDTSDRRASYLVNSNTGYGEVSTSELKKFIETQKIELN